MASSVTALAARLALSTEATIARRLALNRHAAAATTIWPGATITSVGSFAQNTSLNGRYFFSYLIRLRNIFLTSDSTVVTWMSSSIFLVKATAVR